MTTVLQVNGDGKEVWRNGFASVSFTPGAGAHGALDVIGAAGLITLPLAAGRIVKLTGYRFQMPTTTPVTTVWTLHLYNATPTVLNDNDVFAIVAADQAKYLGNVSMAQVVDYTSTYLESWAALTLPPIQVPASGQLTAYLVAVTGITTEAIAHTALLSYEVQP